MPQEVGSPILLALLIPCRRRGLPVDAFFQGLKVRPADLDDPDSRLDWDEFTIIVDRVHACAGGDEALQSLMLDAPGSMFAPGQCQALFPDFLTFLQMVGSLMATHLQIGLQLSTRVLENGRLLCEHHIPFSCRPSRAFAVGLAGFFRGIPRVFGLPDAAVEFTCDDWNGRYLLTLPQPCGPGAADDLPVEVNGREYRSLIEKTSTSVLDHLKQAPWLATVSQKLLEAASMGELAACLQEGLRLNSGCAAGRLWSTRAGGGLDCVHAWGNWPGPWQEHLLMVGTRAVGRLELDPPAALSPAQQRGLSELIHLASIVLDRLLEGSTRDDREGGASFLEHPGLTGRQKQVLSLLVRGLSDKEIAHELGTSPKTVGHQVQVLLRRSGAANRTALTRLCLAGALAPVPPSSAGSG